MTSRLAGLALGWLALKSAQAFVLAFECLYIKPALGMQTGLYKEKNEITLVCI